MGLAGLMFVGRGMRRAKGFAALAGLCLLLAGCTTTGGGTQVAGLTAAPTSFADAGPTTPTTGQATAVVLDASAQRAAKAAEQKALEFGRAGTPVKWKNGKSSGEVVPATPYQVNTFSCRDYVHTVTVNGQTQSARSTACRQPNGTWQPVT